MTPHRQLQTCRQAESGTWLTIGVAGFIGSNLMRTPLKSVVELVNLASGPQRNRAWHNWRMIDSQLENHGEQIGKSNYSQYLLDPISETVVSRTTR